MTVTKKPPPRKPSPKKKVATKKPAPKLTNLQQAVKDLFPHEKSPYGALPAAAQVSGRQTGGYYVTLEAWTVNLRVRAMLGPNGAKVTGGYATWESIAVPRDAPLSIWTGRSLFTMDLDLMVDKYGSYAERNVNQLQSVESDVNDLERMASRLPASLMPPAIRIFGAVPHAGTKWIISGLDWGDTIRLYANGNRTRQAVTIHLTEFRDTTTLANLKGPAKAAPPRKYKIKKGDDLKKIATRMLGKATAWQQIVKLNPKFKPALRGFKLGPKYVGKTILVPAATAKAKGKPAPKKAPPSKHPSTGKG